MERQAWIAAIDEIGPSFAIGAAERDATDHFVAEHYPVLQQRGIPSALVPVELGGGGARLSDMAAILRRIGYYDPSTGLAQSMHQHLVAAQLYRHLRGLPAPLLPRVAAERLVLVSTGARDWLASNGSARRVAGGYRVTARKAFASGSPAGDLAVTSAPYDHPERGRQVLHFALPLDRQGVSLHRDWEAHGMRGTGSNTLVFDDVFVPDGEISLIRPRDAYHPVYNVVIGVAVPLILSVYVGAAERAAEIATERAVRRASDPLTQWTAGELHSQLVLARTCVDRTVQLANDGDFEPTTELANEILILKSHTVDACEQTAKLAMELAGGAGFHRRTGLERLVRDMRAAHFHPLPRKPQIQFTGRVSLGLSPVETEVPGPSGARADQRPALAS